MSKQVRVFSNFLAFSQCNVLTLAVLDNFTFISVGNGVMKGHGPT